jgi:PIN domain nuclease of toxin-antitoxin system
MGNRLSAWLADACALIGHYRAAPAFPAGLRELIERDSARIAVAATTVWEIAIKTARGKLADIRTGRPASLTGMLQAHGFILLPLDAATAEQAGNLPPFHADPFDRALVAMAQRSGRIVLTSDAVIARYGVPVRW